MENIIKDIKNIANNDNKLITKIEKQIESNNKQIESLSGNYQTNTWKRMNEQNNRDSKRYALQDVNKLLNYLLEKCNNKTITIIEENLITKSFRDDIKQYTYRKNLKYPNPDDSTIAEWAREEEKKKLKRLEKANILNTEQLVRVVNEYKSIMEQIEKGNIIDLKAEQIKKLEREYKLQQRGDVNFTTSKKLLNTLMDYAEIKEDDKVLEPSAGIGDIADRIRDITKNIDICEYNYSYAELLKLKGYNVLENDFLQLHKDNSYNKIVANPPFSDEQDHIKHMYDMLSNNGRIVTICSPHWTFANDKQSQDFRNWIEQLDYKIIDVEPGQFEFANVMCKILIINKN